MTTITEEKIGWVKDYAKVTEKEDGKVYLTMNENLTYYCKLLELDYLTLARIGDVYGDMCYEKLEDGTYKLTCNTYFNKEQRESLSGIFFMDSDVLGYFEKAESVDDYMNGDPDVVVERLERDFPDIYDAIALKVKDNLEPDDIPDNLKSEVAYDWICYNPNEAFDKAVDNLGSSDLADCICDAIRNNM